MIQAVGASRLGVGQESIVAVRRAVQHCNDLPVLDHVLTSLLDVLGRPRPALRHIARVVEGDAVLCAQVLRSANRQDDGVYSSARGAVRALGVDRMRRIFMPATSGRSGGYASCAEQEQARVTSRIAYYFAVLGVVHCDPEDALVAGLLHNMGALLFAHAAPELHARLGNYACVTGRDVHAIQKDILGIDQAEAGAYILHRWSIPARIVDAVAWQRRPSARFGFDLCGGVHIASTLARRVLSPARRAEFDMAYLRTVGTVGNLELWSEIATKIAHESSPTEERADAEAAADR